MGGASITIELDELLAHVASQRLILSWSRRGRLVLWSPHAKVSRRIRSAISAHRDELEDLIALDSIETCANRHMHMQAFTYDHGMFYCEVCRRLRTDRAG